MPPLVIIKAGSTFPAVAGELGDFTDWIAAGLSLVRTPIRVVDPRSEELPATDFSGVVVTGSHAMVTDREAWSEAVAAWLRHAVAGGIPVLGICYGHQLLAHALGGDVGYHAGGIEIGTVSVRRADHADGDALFAALPVHFPAQTVHRQSVTRLPPGAVLLAENDFEPHHAFRVGARAWGVQFHPEFSAAAMSGYVAHLAVDIAGLGCNPAALAAAVTETPDSAAILARFGAVVESRLNCSGVMDTHIHSSPKSPVSPGDVCE